MIKEFKKILTLILCLSFMISSINIFSNQKILAQENSLGAIESAIKIDESTVELRFTQGLKARLKFLEDDIFRYNIDPTNTFAQYATPNASSHTATIQAQDDNSNKYSHPNVNLVVNDNQIVITTAKIKVVFDKNTSLLTVFDLNNKIILQEAKAIELGNKTTQSLRALEKEHFFGGGTQNGRFTHRGKSINIANESTWTDGGVASPNPFYWSNNGYGVLRNTFKPGNYRFAIDNDVVSTYHNENEFDAYYFISTKDGIENIAKDILTQYYKVTGNPVLLPEYAFYLAHLNCYNRDAWSASNNNRGWLLEDGRRYNEHGQRPGYVIGDQMMAESLNNIAPTIDASLFNGVLNADTYKFSARAVIDGHVANDIPLGWFLPNDGYGCGYGQNGYYQRRQANEDKTRMIQAVDANIENLRQFTNYAESYGVRSGLWTQAALTVESSEVDRGYQGFHTLRDFNKEVLTAGVSALKTDVAWVGHGYSMALNSVKDGYNTLILANKRPTLVSLDGWAGFQRYTSVWTGDQTGGNWEYIRFHIPTYIGQSLSGNPNVGSDVDGIFGGSGLITTRDLQFKTFTQTMLDMDGWGSIPKKPYIAGDPYTAINRMYLKLKAELMPYIYTTAHESVNGLPMIRAMFLEEANDYTYSTASQYQYMFGNQFLVAPIYQNTNMQANGNDIRNNIYLPNTASSWIDYFTGKHYEPGKVVNNFDAPLWKLPLFVKNGAIIPMYEENNNPMPISATNLKGLDKTRRVIEFYPDGNSEYQLIEDDGISINPQNLSYGNKVTTRITSAVNNDVATLTIHNSNGNYNGYNPLRHTNVVVNVSKKPQQVIAKNGNQNIQVQEVSTLAEFKNRANNNEAVWFYDASPNLNKYAKDSEEFKNVAITTSPKTYISFTKTNVNENSQSVEIYGFENAKNFDANSDNPNLTTPNNVVAGDENKTPVSINLTWDRVENATSYEVEADGVIYVVGDNPEFNHTDLAYHSTHRYRIRARNASGYSSWSNVLEATSLEDPYRNIIKSRIFWEGGDQWGKLKAATDLDLKTMFHSTGGNVVREKIPFIFDLQKGYNLDKFEYYPRDNFGNGTVKKMKVSVSLDGVNWKVVNDGSQTWTYNSSQDVAANVKTVDLTSYYARYVKLEVLESVGGYFSANELMVYKKDNTLPFEVGSIAIQARDRVDENDFTNLKNYLGLSSKDNPTFENQVKNYSLDINMNDIYDVYDYTHTVFKLNGGTRKTGSVDGDILLLKDKDSLEALEYLTIDVYADNVSNLNAFGEVINYNPTQLEFIESSISPRIAQMTDLSVNKVYSDHTAYYNLALANVGDQRLFDGSGILVSLKFKALTNVVLNDDTINLKQVGLIGPDFSYLVSKVNTDVEIPDIPNKTTLIYPQDAFDITMTNDELTSDDGSNVNSLIQTNSYNGLFNGQFNRDFEFKWDHSSNHVEGKLPSYVKVPTTIHFSFKNPSVLDSVSVFSGSDRSNGAVRSIKAKAFFEDGSQSDEIQFNEFKNEFVFNFNSDKKVVKVDITPLSTTGRTRSDDAENQENRMLTLTEIQFKYTQGVDVSEVELAEGTLKEVYQGSLIDVSANVLPIEANNRYYKVVSSNAEIARVITLSDENQRPNYKLHALKEGETTIKISSIADESKFVEYTLRVLSGADKTELKQLLDNNRNHSSKIYTTETYNQFIEAYNEGLAIYEKVDASRLEIEQAINKLQNAVDGLRYIEIDESKKINPSHFNNLEALHSENNLVNRAFDEDLSTYWESPYFGANAQLPQSLIFELDGEYTLEKISLTSHTARNGGVLNYQVEVLNTNGQWVKVSENNSLKDAYLHNQNVKLSSVFESVKTNKVKLTFTNSVGRVDSEDNRYVRIAEIDVYGSKVEVIDYQELNALINANLNKQASDYQKASWDNFSDALANARLLINNANSQQEVDNAKANLEMAIANLQMLILDKEYVASNIDASVISIANRLDENLALVVEKSSQKFDKADVYDVYFVNQNKAKVEVNEGEFLVKLPYNKDLKPVYVLYLGQENERINLEKVDENHIYFKTTHFSTYAIIYEAKEVIVSKPSPVVKQLPATGSISYNFIGASLLLSSILIILKNKKD